MKVNNKVVDRLKKSILIAVDRSTWTYLVEVREKYSNFLGADFYIFWEGKSLCAKSPSLNLLANRKGGVAGEKHLQLFPKFWGAKKALPPSSAHMLISVKFYDYFKK